MSTSTPAAEGDAPETIETDSINDSPEAWADAGDEAEGGTTADEGQGSEEQQEEGEEVTEQTDPYAQAPEFWSADRKAVWDKIADPTLRQALHEIDKERVTATNKKIEEAALSRKGLEDQVRTFTSERDQLVAFWKDLAPKLGQAFQNKWAAVDWQKLAAENPSEYVKQKAMADQDFALLQDSFERNRAEVEAANKRAKTALDESKRAEHEKLAKQFPHHFGAEKAQATYDELGKYLLDAGCPADRIGNIYESFVVGTALKAMLYDKAQAALKARKSQTTTPTTATQTPTRVPPGPRRGNQTAGDADRQANERLRTGQTLSDDDVARLFG